MKRNVLLKITSYGVLEIDCDDINKEEDIHYLLQDRINSMVLVMDDSDEFLFDVLGSDTEIEAEDEVG